MYIGQTSQVVGFRRQAPSRPTDCHAFFEQGAGRRVRPALPGDHAEDKQYKPLFIRIAQVAPEAERLTQSRLGRDVLASSHVNGASAVQTLRPARRSVRRQRQDLRERGATFAEIAAEEPEPSDAPGEPLRA